MLQAFARHVDDPRAFLVMAGPEVGIVADDPEGARVLADVRPPGAGSPRTGASGCRSPHC